MHFVHIMNTLTYHANSRMSAAIPMNMINSFRMNLIALKTKRSTKPIISAASIRSNITHHSLSLYVNVIIIHHNINHGHYEFNHAIACWIPIMLFQQSLRFHDLPAYVLIVIIMRA